MYRHDRIYNARGVALPPIVCTGRCQAERSIESAFRSVMESIHARNESDFHTLTGFWARAGRLRVEVTAVGSRPNLHATCEGGGCELRFTERLANAPDAVVRAVVAHELAHVVQHGRRMWFDNDVGLTELDADARIHSWGFEPYLVENWSEGLPLYPCESFSRATVAARSVPGQRYHPLSTLGTNPPTLAAVSAPAASAPVRKENFVTVGGPIDMMMPLLEQAHRAMGV